MTRAERRRQDTPEREPGRLTIMPKSGRDERREMLRRFAKKVTRGAFGLDKWRMARENQKRTEVTK